MASREKREAVLVALHEELRWVFPEKFVGLSRIAAVCGLAEERSWEALRELHAEGLVQAFDGGPGRSLDRGAGLTEKGAEVTVGLFVVPSSGPVPEFAEGLDDIQRALLDAMVEQELRVAEGPATRRQLRTTIRNTMTPAPSIEAANASLDSLAGRFVEIDTSPEPSCRVNLRGLVSSRWGTDAIELVDRLLTHLRELQKKDPALRRYSWTEVQRGCRVEPKALNFVYLTIKLTQLAARGFTRGDGDRWWTPPPDFDVLLDKHASAVEYVRTVLASRDLGVRESVARPLQNDASKESPMPERKPDPKQVFLVHGRNLRAATEMGNFLRACGLEPINFGDLRAEMGGTPTVDCIIEEGMVRAQGVVALITGDEFAGLHPEFRREDDGEEAVRRWQARPNVIFEAGMAFGRDRDRVVFVLLGNAVLFTDVAGVHVLRPTNDPRGDRGVLRETLRRGMKCAVGDSSDWMHAGDFQACVAGQGKAIPRDPFPDATAPTGATSTTSPREGGSADPVKKETGTCGKCGERVPKWFLEKVEGMKGKLCLHCTSDEPYPQAGQSEYDYVEKLKARRAERQAEVARREAAEPVKCLVCERMVPRGDTSSAMVEFSNVPNHSQQQRGPVCGDCVEATKGGFRAGARKA